MLRYFLLICTCFVRFILIGTLSTHYLLVTSRELVVWTVSPCLTDTTSGSFLFNYKEMQKFRSLHDASIALYHPELTNTTDESYNLTISSTVSNNRTPIHIRTISISFNPALLEHLDSGIVRLDIEPELQHLRRNNFHSLIFIRIIRLSDGQTLGQSADYSMMAVCSSRSRSSRGSSRGMSSSGFSFRDRSIRISARDSVNCAPNQTTCGVKRVPLSDRYEQPHNLHSPSIFDAIIVSKTKLYFYTCGGSCKSVGPESFAYSKADDRHTHTLLTRYVGHDSLSCVATHFSPLEIVYRDVKGHIRVGFLMDASAERCSCIIEARSNYLPQPFEDGIYK